MATCSNCGGYLDTQHRCRGLWRLRLQVWRAWLLAGLVSGVVATALLWVVYGRVSWLAVILAAIAGALVYRAYRMRH